MYYRNHWQVFLKIVAPEIWQEKGNVGKIYNGKNIEKLLRSRLLEFLLFNIKAHHKQF